VFCSNCFFFEIHTFKLVNFVEFHSILKLVKFLAWFSNFSKTTSNFSYEIISIISRSYCSSIWLFLWQLVLRELKSLRLLILGSAMVKSLTDAFFKTLLEEVSALAIYLIE